MTEPQAMPPYNYEMTTVLQECKECLCCHAECPVVQEIGFKEFAGPYVLTKIASRWYDTREDVGLADQRLMTAVQEGLFHCILCGRCTDVCMSGKLVETPDYPTASIDHVKVFREMMDAAEAKGWKP